MRVSPRTLMLIGVTVSFSFFWMASPLRAQNGQQNFTKVTITTADGVDLQGYWYAANQQNAPVVMLLHALDEGAAKKEWYDLATALQKEGYAVLAFDFRGHGGSTNFAPQQFWSPLGGPMTPAPALWNTQRMTGASKVNPTLDFKKFDPAYYPILVNDIAAAKAWLDLKNDAGGCNSSSLILIGAETGATLGSIWLNSEWNRYQLQQAVGGFGVPRINQKHPYGMDTIAAIWLSISPKLSARDNTTKISRILFKAGKSNQTPMVFVCNAADDTDKAIAEGMENKLKPKDDKGNLFKFTAAVPVKNAGRNIKGRSLLEPGLGTIASITGYLKVVVPQKQNAWVQQDFTRSQYVWQDPNTHALIQANAPGDRTFYFDSFSRYK